MSARWKENAGGGGGRCEHSKMFTTRLTTFVDGFYDPGLVEGVIIIARAITHNCLPFSQLLAGLHCCTRRRATPSSPRTHLSHDQVSRYGGSAQ